MGESSGKWPKDLAALSDIYTRELELMGVAGDVRAITDRLLLAQANYGGGRMFYLPKAERLRREIRDQKIYSEFNGRNQDALAMRYNLSVQRIYRILEEQRELDRKNRQSALF